MKFKAGDKVTYRTLNKTGIILQCISDKDEKEKRYYVQIKTEVWSVPERCLLKVMEK